MSASIILTPFWSGLLVGAVGFSLLSALIIGFLNARQKKLLCAVRAESDQLLALNQRLNTDLAITEQRIAQLDKLESTVGSLHAQLESARREVLEHSTARARAEQQIARIVELDRKISENDKTISELHAEIARLGKQNAELATRIEEERNSAAEKLELIRSAEKQMMYQFESLGARILDEKSRTFSEQNRLDLDRLLSPLREQIGDFRKKVEDVYVADSSDRASLREAIRGLNQENQRISREANNLVRALKGDRKVQGTWGELVLEKVLEQSGLRKGVEYHSQGGFRGQDNRLLKPDVIVHLPDDKDIVIDSKVSLLAYESYCSAESDDHRQKSLSEHIQSVRSHIKGLGEKDYSSLRGIRSLDFVLMFMPVETAFLLAFEHDDNLFSEAFGRNIIVVTPTTLLATLRTIDNIWRYERQNENARIIAGKAANLYDKIRGFVEDFEKLGSQIATVQGTYETAMGKLTQGKGNLVRQASRFAELGVKVRKQLPKSMLEQAASEDFEENGEVPGTGRSRSRINSD